MTDIAEKIWNTVAASCWEFEADTEDKKKAIAKIKRLIRKSGGIA